MIDSNHWIVLHPDTRELYLMPDSQAVINSIALTWSRVAPENKPTTNVERDTITVADNTGKVLVIAKALRAVEFHEHGTHL